MHLYGFASPAIAAVAYAGGPKRPKSLRLERYPIAKMRTAGRCFGPGHRVNPGGIRFRIRLSPAEGRART